MINAVVFTNRYGRSLRCVFSAPERTRMAVTKIDGLGPGTATVNIHNIVTIDGGYFGSARYGARNIVAYLRFTEWDENGVYVPIEQTRHVAYSFFQPKTQIRILIETDDRSLVITGVVESCEPTIFDPAESVQVSILCPGYYFKMVSDGSDVHTARLYGNGLFEFPFCNNSRSKKLLQFGTVSTKEEHEMYYDGDAENGFTLEIGFTGSPVTGVIQVGNTPIGNADNGNVGFLPNESTVLPDWADQDLVQNYISVDLAKLATKLSGRFTGNLYDNGNKIVISTIAGEKIAKFVLENGTAFNILGYLDHLEWIKVHPGFNRFLTVCNAESVGHFYINAIYEALYSGV